MPTEPTVGVAAAPPSLPTGAAVPSPGANTLEYANALAAPTASRFRWVVLALVFFAITINYIDRMVMGILAPDLREAYQIDNLAYGYITAAFGLSYALGQMVSGRWLDWIGVRVGYAVALTAWSAASMLHALSRSAWGFGFFRGVLGVTESPAYPAAVKTLAEWFPKKERALAMGVANAGANVGAVLAPAMVPWLAINYGWQAAFIVSGAIGLVWLFFWIPLYRKPAEHPRVSAEELAYIQSDPTDGEVGPLRLRPLSRRQKTLAGSLAGGGSFLLILMLIAMPLNFSARALLVGAGIGAVIGGATAFFLTRPNARLFFHRQSWGFIAGKALTDPIWSFYLFWLPTFLKDQHGVNLSGVALPLIVIYLMADVGSIAGGWMSSSLIKRGWSLNAARKTTLLVCALCVVPASFVSVVDSMWTAVLIVGVALAAHQGFSSNLYTLVSDTFPKRAVGSVAGLGGTFGYIGYTLFGILTGWILDLTNKNYLPVFIMAGSAYLLAFVIIHLAMPHMEPAVIEDDDAPPPGLEVVAPR
jgi:ACS family hexuronate transporter-like MFS transporter